MRTHASTLAIVTLTLTLGGCNVTVGGERSEQRAAIQEVVGDGELTIDLTAPPSRADVALPEGRNTVILERDGDDPIDVTVVFRDGTRLSTQALWISATADDADSDPSTVTIRRAGDTLEDLRTAVDEAVSDLGVERSRADTALQQSEGATDGQGDVLYSLPTDIADPDRLSLRTIAKSARAQYAVNYIVEWGLP